MDSKPEYISKVLVDGDVVAYRASASADQLICENCGEEYPRDKVTKDFSCKVCYWVVFYDKPVEEAYNKVDDLMGYIIQETVSFPTSDTFKVYLSGKSNFRHTVAKTHGYKANRVGKPKPIHLAATRDYLVREYGAVISSGCEADDLIAMEAMKGDPEGTVIASIDKDFQTVNCWMFNFTKDEWKYSTEWEALQFFYEQVLTGDAVDNIKGIHRVGPVKARKILEGAATEEELFQKCLDAYEGDLGRVIENAQLLHLQRYKGQLWEPPNADKDK